MRMEGSVGAVGMDAHHTSEGAAAMLGSGDPRG